jgi:hypothetical protein
LGDEISENKKGLGRTYLASRMRKGKREEKRREKEGGGEVHIVVENEGVESTDLLTPGDRIESEKTCSPARPMRIQDHCCHVDNEQVYTAQS